MEEKKWYTSKSVWTGFVTFVGGILLATEVISVELTPETVAMVLGIVVVLLRLITGKPIVW